MIEKKTKLNHCAWFTFCVIRASSSPFSLSDCCKTLMVSVFSKMSFCASSCETLWDFSSSSSLWLRLSFVCCNDWCSVFTENKDNHLILFLVSRAMSSSHIHIFMKKVWLKWSTITDKNAYSINPIISLFYFDIYIFLGYLNNCIYSYFLW